jgi:small-conductance mechanosensitive channel
MDRNNLPGLSPLWLISLAMVLGTAILVALPVSIANGEAIKSSDWIGFSGNVVAGVMTLVAAIIAWFAVQRQIQAQEESAGRASERLQQERDKEQAEAKFAAVIVLTQTVHAAAAVMNVIEQVLDIAANPRSYVSPGVVPFELHDAKAKLSKVMQQLKTTMDHFSIAQAWQGLGIQDRTNYLIVTSTLHTVTNIYDHPPPIDDLQVIRNQHETLSKLALYLRAFDDELADVFLRDSKI